MGDEGFGYTLDEALSAIGFGRFQFIVLAYSGLGWVAEAMEIMLLSFVGPAIQPEWGLSATQESFISTVAFAGMLVGAYSWGVISDSFGRKKGFLGASIITSLAGLMSAFAPNYISLLILRCIVGVGLGCGHVFTSWFVEFVPVPNRGAWMVVFSTFWTVGTIMEASLAWWIMPTYGWRWLFGLSAIPSLVALLFYGLVPESPRYLCTQGRLAEARHILENGAALNQKKLPVGQLVSDHIKIMTNEDESLESTMLLSSTRSKTSSSQRSSFSIFMLLSPTLIRTTLLLWFLYFANTFSYYGVILLTSQLSMPQSECDSLTLHSENIKDSSLYVNVFITSLAELPGLGLAAIILDRVGRKISMEIMLVAGFALLLPLIVHQNEVMTTVFLFGARMFVSASFIVVCIYAPEVYPTNLRATGVGIATAIGRIGGMVCPLIAVGMGSGCHQTVPVILFEVTILLAGLSVVFLPFETKGKDLTDTVDLPVQMGDEGFGYTLDEALSAIGFGRFQFIVLAYSGLGWVAEAMEMMLLSFVGPAIGPEWGLSATQESYISTVAFAGMLVGAYSWGVISDNFGRKKGFLGALTITSLAGLMSAFAPNYISLLILRSFVGVGLGCGHVFTSWFLEFVPVPNRGAWMVVFSTFWTVGTIMEASLAWWIMPTYGWRWLFGISAIPSLFALLLYGLVPESPRYLCTQGRLAEARHILENGAALNQKKLPVGLLVSDHIKINEDESLESTMLLSSTRSKTSGSRRSSSSIFMLLSPTLIRTTLLLWFLYFANTFSYYGVILLTSQLSMPQSECDSPTLHSENIKDPSVYVNGFITSLAELPGLGLAALILDRVGRKISMEIMFVAAFVLLLPLIVHQNEVMSTIFLFGARMFVSASFIVVCIYAPEVYPTNLRATGVGIATAIGKIGGMVCPLIAVGMGSGCHQTVPVILFEVTILLACLSVVYLPFETKGKELTDTIDLPVQVE
ncbi:hypothetical protein SSX86_002982 [Deinandra increscens subsp. villosa]|uniref:Major facilitator superfamily (MFS) profile domain-containing protein n=1 Tax=Deinandra increscens subsp. villosa TaxID=3103831 RepID=A0AAP0DXH1_9ASTR